MHEPGVVCPERIFRVMDEPYLMQPDEDDPEPFEPFTVQLRGVEALGTDGRIYSESLWSSPSLELVTAVPVEVFWRAVEISLYHKMREAGVWPADLAVRLEP